MRVALVSRELPPHGGGIGSYTAKTAAALAAAGDDVTVISEAWDGIAGDQVSDGVRIHRLAPPRLRPAVVGRAVAVARALRRLGPFDVVQACEWRGEAALYSLIPRAPLVTRLATPHYLVERINGATRPQRLRTAVSRGLERLQTVRSRAVISPSGALADDVARRWRIPRDRISVVPTGIRLPGPSLAAATGDVPARPYAVYFGRLEVRKGVDVWIEALPAVLAAHPDIDAVFVGEDIGIDGISFLDLARRRAPDLADRLHFLPRLPHQRLFPIVAGSLLVVMPSLWESLANALLEAMALGRPVIATTGSGFAEVITDGADGWLVPPGDAAALAAAAIAALDDREALAAVGRAAARRAQDFDLDAMAARLSAVHRSLLPAAAVMGGASHP